MIIFSDLDGTFLTTNKTMSAASERALDALAQAAIEFVPCTGRAAGGIPAPILAHPAVHYVITANGAAILKLSSAHPTKLEAAQYLSSRPLDRKKALAVWEVAQTRDVTFDIFADGACLTRRDQFERLGEFVPDPHVLAGMRRTRTPIDEDPAEIIPRVELLERVAMYWKDPADRDAVMKGLANIADIEVTRSYPVNIEVMEGGTTKGRALEWLCRYLGEDVQHTWAFGDNLNDVEMLTRAGTGVAMANAEAEAAAVADLTCATNDEDGVAQTIMELLGRSSASIACK
ncbi:Cof-type HAD-IIB family hydrolase [Collinsella sp. AGMB00827]|uniref:Cof-type HAD-IIB family hydrolase n=1 Tax=Collinsella ureilytica TaxID=2869515 RepID=A0ABS7MIB8_9ACTN|nr:HAD family hydrolase [Collinsella urealyticum]MBY4797116.1 Cof-type HAD-IIB family hydrolase [Collinsella urealyticum]